MQRRGKVKPRIYSVLILSALCLSLPAVGQEEAAFNNNWGDPGFNLVSQSPKGVEIVYSVPYVGFDEVAVGGETMTKVMLPGAFLPNNAGAPDLPGVSRYIALPRGAAATIEILGVRKRAYPDMDVLPAAPIPKETDDTPPVYEKDPAIYGVDAFYPAAPVMISEQKRLRGVDVVILGITPFAYNPVQKELVVYTDIRIKVSFKGGTGLFGEERLRSRFFEPLLEQHLVNYGSLPAVDFSARAARGAKAGECDYMIFIPDDTDFQTWAETVRDFRVKQGISTEIYNIASIGGTATAIESAIDTAYNTWANPPVAVLMLGDYPDMPAKTWSSYCLSDNIYADVDGDDLPDLNIARITAHGSADLDIMINKFIDYERTPPTNSSFYQNPVCAGGWQTERWFILCTEIVHGYMTNILGKTPVREYAIYSGSPGSTWSTNQNTYMLVNYFGPSGLGYIPATPAHLNDWGANATRLNNDLNSGAFWLMHRDHGYELGWGEPDYNVNDLTGLHNQDLPFVLSINCCTGEYNYNSGDCFSEAFQRMNYGALGVIAASGVSYSFVNDTFVFGIHDSMWPDFDPGYGGSTGDHNLLPGFGQMSGKWYLQASSWPYNTQHKVYTHHLFHIFGDAFTQVFSEAPQSAGVSHAPTINVDDTSFSVTAAAGTTIALTLPDGTILGVADGTGSPVSVPVDPTPQTPGTMYVTVTGPNYQRYEADVFIIVGGALSVWPSQGTPASVLPGPSTDIQIMILDGSENYVPGTGMVHYRFDPGDSYATSLFADLGGDLYLATIPGARPDGLPEFYFSAHGDGGTTVTCPADAPVTVYSMDVAGLPEIVIHDDFESDLGWTVESIYLITGEWERVEPIGTIHNSVQAQPGYDNPAGSGTFCFVTQNGPVYGGSEWNDVDGGPTRLISPAFDLSSGEGTVGYYRWYFNDDDEPADDPFTVDVSNDDGATWVNVETVLYEPSWESVSFNVSDYVTPTGAVRVRFCAVDYPNNSCTEAGVDDFRVERINNDPSLWADAYSISATAGCSVGIILDAGSAYAGREYIVVGGISGSYPGQQLPGGNVLPVVVDNVTSYILAHINTAVFQNFRANLYLEGEGLATLDSQGPIDPVYVGETLTFAYTLTGGYDFVSNAVTVEILP